MLNKDPSHSLNICLLCWSYAQAAEPHKIWRSKVLQKQILHKEGKGRNVIISKSLQIIFFIKKK